MPPSLPMHYVLTLTPYGKKGYSVWDAPVLRSVPYRQLAVMDNREGRQTEVIWNESHMCITKKGKGLCQQRAVL